MSKKDFRLIIVGGDCPKVKAKPCITQVKYSLEFLGASLGAILLVQLKDREILKRCLCTVTCKRMATNTWEELNIT